MNHVYCQTNKDCLRASLASLLELGYDDVAYVDPDLSVDEFWQAYRKILNQIGFEFVLADAKQINEQPLKGFSIGIGKTPTGIDHAVVCENGKEVFNPSRASKITQIDGFMFLIPMFPWRHKIKEPK